jgi:hypothetical protein
MVDTPGDKLLPLSRIAELLPAVRGDKPPNRSTLYKWAKYGLTSRAGRKIYLATEFVGGTLCTTLDDVYRLGRQKDDLDLPPPTRRPTTARQRAAADKRVAAAMDRLRSAGIVK